MTSEERDMLMVRIDANLDNLCKTVKEHTEDDKSKFSEIFDRLRSNERVIWGAVAVVTFIGVVIKFVPID